MPVQDSEYNLNDMIKRAPCCGAKNDGYSAERPHCFWQLCPLICRVVLVFTLLPVGGRGSLAQERIPAPPNILWISVEDLSPRLGAYGDDLGRTPHLDRLAAEGVRYTRAFTTAGVCAPSRAAIITSMYQNAIGAHHMRTTSSGPGLPTPYAAVPPSYVKAFPEYLRAAGYYTTNNVKTDYQIGTPFTIWDESSREAHWRNRPDEDQPFFSVFNVTRTHESQAWPESDEDGQLVTDPDRVTVPPYYPDTPVVRETLARHYDNIAEMDRRVGEILSQLEEDGLAEETLVFFWTDHGDGLPRAKRWLYDAGLHVPLIVRTPEKYRRWVGAPAPGSASERLVSLMDLGPTVLSLAGVPAPAHLQGRAFLGPQQASEREYVYAARDRIDESYDMVRAVRGERFKYIRNFYPDKPYAIHVPYRNRMPIMRELFRRKAAGRLEGPQTLWMRDRRPPEELYDTESDPDEIQNLADDPAYRNVVERMRRAMDDWMVRVHDLGRIPEAQMVRQWWPEGKRPATHAPIIVPRRSRVKMTELPDTVGGTFEDPLEVLLHSPTQGASMAYRMGETERWKLYTGPIRLTEGTTTIHAKAIRYGYQPSGEARATFTVTSMTN